MILARLKNSTLRILDYTRGANKLSVSNVVEKVIRSLRITGNSVYIRTANNDSNRKSIRKFIFVRRILIGVGL